MSAAAVPSTRDVVVLVPAYEPDTRLAELVDTLSRTAPQHEVLVVDDGSGPAYDTIFALAELAGATVVRFPTNRGKGAALRAGFAWVREHRAGRDVVCADCDGQHTPADIQSVAEGLRDGTDMVLGVRMFTGQVPARSRFGNDATRILFRWITGNSILDTQTGLRAYPARLLGWLEGIEGDRFEYELNLLLAAGDDHLSITQVPIETIYLADNETSHFRPLTDSARIYRPLLAHGLRRSARHLRFATSSLTGFAIDTALLLVLQGALGSLLGALVVARAVSGAVNFTLNRHWVFRAEKQPLGSSLWRYLQLAVLLLVANYLLMLGFTSAGVSLPIAKVATEVSLVVTSYLGQALWVFARGHAGLHHSGLEESGHGTDKRASDAAAVRRGAAIASGGAVAGRPAGVATAGLGPALEPAAPVACHDRFLP